MQVFGSHSSTQSGFSLRPDRSRTLLQFRIHPHCGLNRRGLAALADEDTGGVQAAIPRGNLDLALEGPGNAEAGIEVAVSGRVAVAVRRTEAPRKVEPGTAPKNAA